MMGLYIHGKMAGYRANTRSFNGKEITNHELGIQVERENQFGVTESETLIVRMPQALINPTMINQYQGMIGKDVIVPVWVGTYIGKNGAGYQYNLDSKKPIELDKPGVASSPVKSVGAA